jgi:hypothetical protein
LIHGARAVIRHVENKADYDNWLTKLVAGLKNNVAAVVLANRNVWTVWVLLAKDRIFLPDHAVSAHADAA